MIMANRWQFRCGSIRLFTHGINITATCSNEKAFSEFSLALSRISWPCSTVGMLPFQPFLYWLPVVFVSFRSNGENSFGGIAFGFGIHPFLGLVATIRLLARCLLNQRKELPLPLGHELPEPVGSQQYRIDKV